MNQTNQSETRREIAERIVAEWSDLYQVTEVGLATKARLADAIEAALLQRDQRAVAIVKAIRNELGPDYDGQAAGACEDIVAAIEREGG